MKKMMRASLAVAMTMFVASAAQANDAVHVGKAQGTAWTFLPVDIGIEQGIFAKLGLDVDSASLGGDAKVQQALVAGSVDFGLGSGPGMALASKGGEAIGSRNSPGRRATSRRSCSRIRRSRKSPISRAR